MTTAVALALYNGGRFIEKQLESLRLQTKALDQVVLCDDGSTDNTVFLVREYIKKHHLEERWRLLINEKNLGYARNFYRAISQCTTDVVFLSDQDDIWEVDKIKKMTQVMETYPQVTLLASKHSIIDANDQTLHGALAPTGGNTHKVTCINVEDAVRELCWPGMCLCIRKDFFESIKDKIQDSTLPHDILLELWAASGSGFWEYDYIGAYHRRHENNTAQEEHRVSKLLDLQRKVSAVRGRNKTLSGILSAGIPFSETDKKTVEVRFALSQARLLALESRSLWRLLKAYPRKYWHILRLKSFLCDLWLILFGDYKALRNADN